ncbi:MAG: putative anti-sigma regulatory factor, serine/threonine protein kinase [Phycisphaerales bacterium]|nr:putative anti-sigma regulatory factor, serine/threonine protein kinase [Phycisphaerales bacterium]
MPTTSPDAARAETLSIAVEADVVRVRQAVRTRAAALGFSIVDQTKVVTAASELARNTLKHGGGGHCRVEPVTAGGRVGLRLVFEDQGPGIPDVRLALTDGYTTGGGMGLGLSGSRRLMTDFDLWSEVGKGTRVTVAKWK